MRLYIAGPMSGHAEHNFPAFDAAAETLRSQGYIVFNPADNDRANGFDFVDTPADTPLPDDFDLRTTLKEDLSWICDHADGLALLPGWGTSKGVNAEVALALALGIPARPLHDWVYTNDGILV